jgi:hypothetical protein
MHISEFEPQFNRLKLTYGEKAFPIEREKLFFKRYMRADAKAFTAAIESVILQMPQPSLIIGMIDQSLAASKPRQAGADAFREPEYTCPPCRDFGYGWNGDTVVRCLTCDLGRITTDTELKRHQESYDRGKAMFKAGGRLNIGKPLPYNPKVRGAV